jgi:hypothetical protein
MKNHYDKIFLLVAVLALAASAGYYFTSEGNLKESQANFEKTMTLPFAGEQWKEVKVEPLKLGSVDWPEAKAQDEVGLWLYQIFTPPKIWIDNGEFSAEPPVPVEGPGSGIGFKYAGLKHDAYPILYKGYFIDPEGEIVVQLYDDARTTALRGKINEEILYRAQDGKMKKAGLVVKSFDKKMVRQQDGTIRQVIIVSIADEALGREITIESGKPTFLEESRIIVLAPEGRGGKSWEIKKAGDKFEADGGVVYTVKELDFENESLLVEKMTPRTNNPNPQITLIKFSKDSSPSIIK